MQLSGLKKCLKCMKSIVKSEGILALYRSLPISMLMNAPYAITTVSVNENMKKVVKPKERKFKFLSYFYCAAFAGSIASVVTCPLDNIKTKLQTQSTLSSCEKIEYMMSQIEKEIKADQNKAKVNNFNDDSKKIVNNSKMEIHHQIENEATREKFIKDMEKLQVEEKKHIVKYKSIYQTANLIYREEGFFRGFFRGVTPRILFNSPSCAISWASYELMKHCLS